MSTIFYLGPPSTLTHEAAVHYFGTGTEVQYQPCASPSEVMRCLSKEAGAFAVVPIENSIQGEVLPTLDALLFDSDHIFVVGELSLPVTFSFFSLAGAGRPTVAVSHSHALTQCRKFIARQGLKEQTASTTVEACRMVAEQAAPNLGAIASPKTGASFNLQPLATEIEDFVGAHTRFLIIHDRFVRPAGDAKSMITIVPPTSGTGILADMASAFAIRGVNIFAIHSRPAKHAGGEYVFTLTTSGSVCEGGSRQAIESLMQQGYRVKVLGSYPYASGPLPSAPFARLPGAFDLQSFSDFLRVNIAK